MRVLGLVPARGGSRGVPRKNTRLLCGRPLLWYTARAAHGSRQLTRVVLSTDDPEIAEIGRGCGLDVPFIRPDALARDDAPMLPVVQHALRALEPQDGRYEAVCLLQPTNPLREAGDIDACIELLATSGADSVVTTQPVPAQYNPHWVYFPLPDGSLRLSTGEAAPVSRRQALPPAVHRDGTVYVTRREVLVDADSLYGARVLGYAMEPARSLNIDTPADWALAERLVAARERAAAGAGAGAAAGGMS
ncbi:MAG TPA: acylneuraminate cytidylyltransferase family protein [Gemmatimonadales bacterium]|nr:acylneuraminate cytidylyltransferase family protein [Gemmatimonadales bacterium]